MNFAYDKRNPVLKDLSFTIPVRFEDSYCRPSGSGKNYNYQFNICFYDVDSGEIRLGNKDIRDYKVRKFTEKIFPRFPGCLSFRDTIENNICLQILDASHEQVVEAAKKARCHNFIMELPGRL